jgi:cathepsin L
MRFVVVALLVALAVSSYPEELSNLFNTWKVQYNVQYDTPEEDAFRLAIFSENYALITAWNANPQDSFTMGVNQFADLTNEEFGARYASGYGLVGGHNVGNGTDPYCPSAVNCPTLASVNVSTLNWTATGAVTPIKNQGQCGSCWTFSTTGSLEGLYYLNNSKLMSFSEQQIVDCCKTADGCGGGFPYLAMVYTAANGIEQESEYPYTGQNGQCKFNKADATAVNTGYQCVTQKSQAQLLAAAAAAPLSIAVQANQVSWQFYQGGVVTELCGATLDHAVLLVGWGQHKSSTNAYYVKNSWGASWGDNGYIWIGESATDNDGYGVCGILRCATVSVNN